MDFACLIWFYPLQLLYFIGAQVAAFLESGSSSNYLLNPLTQLLKSLIVSLLFDVTRCSRLILCSRPGISHVSKEPWFLLVKQMIFRAYSVGYLIGHYFYTFQQVELQNPPPPPFFFSIHTNAPIQVKF